MNPFLFFVSVFVAVFHFSSSAEAKKRCEFQPIQFLSAAITAQENGETETLSYQVQRGSAGSFEIDTGDTAIRIHNPKTNKVCEVQVNIVSRGEVFWLKETDRMLYHSSNGSEKRFSLVDMNSCQTLWKSRPHLSGQAIATGVNINSTCGVCEETRNFSGVCDCTAAEVWKLSNKCDLIQNSSESRKLTREQIKLGFIGTKKVRAARSPAATFAR